MSKIGHALFHIGAVAVQVAAATGFLAPPPFNIAIVGGVAATQGIVALVNHKKKA